MWEYIFEALIDSNINTILEEMVNLTKASGDNRDFCMDFMLPEFEKRDEMIMEELKNYRKALEKHNL